MKVGLLVVSFARDLEFFQKLARSYAKFVSGFYAAKVVVPTRDVPVFRGVADPCGICVSGFDEEPGKGFLSHLRMKCYADHHLPEADIIFHVDSDCVFIEQFSPADRIVDGKPILLWREFSRFLKEPLRPNEAADFMAGKPVPNRGQYWWKFGTDHALGWDVQRETMCGMPICHVREVYGKARAVIQNRFGDFDRYLFSCREEFPQTFCEFNVLGAVAHQYYPDRYRWWHETTEGRPPLKVTQGWSRGGLDGEWDYGREVGGRQTARQLFARLGL